MEYYAELPADQIKAEKKVDEIQVVEDEEEAIPDLDDIMAEIAQNEQKQAAGQQGKDVQVDQVMKSEPV